MEEEIDIAYAIDVLNDAINETTETELKTLRRVALNTLVELIDDLIDGN